MSKDCITLFLGLQSHTLLEGVAYYFVDKHFGSGLLLSYAADCFDWDVLFERTHQDFAKLLVNTIESEDLIYFFFRQKSSFFKNQIKNRVNTLLSRKTDHFFGDSGICKWQNKESLMLYTELSLSLFMAGYLFNSILNLVSILNIYGWLKPWDKALVLYFSFESLLARKTSFQYP